MAHRPRATYRLQLHAGFTLADARRLLDYLADLGISDVYLSPIMEARHTSTHGYDVTDTNQVREVLGGDAGFRALAEDARRRGMGIVLDFVPNHMAAHHENPWWFDVLEHGPRSPFAPLFHLHWTHPPASLRGASGRLVLPVLGDTYGNALEDGDLLLGFQDGRFVLRYFDQVFPLHPQSTARLLMGEGPQRHGLPAPLQTALREVLAVLSDANPFLGPPLTRAECAALQDARRRLAQWTEEEPAFRRLVDDTLHRFAGRPGEPDSFDPLDDLIRDQAWRLAYWRTANDAVNYRRFFDINDLVALRMEDPEVFEHTHARLLEYVNAGLVTGVRLDHIDGLADPESYLVRLRDRLAGENAPWILVEKILGEGEKLPDWPVAGTTGYDFLNLLNGMLVDQHGIEFLDRSYARFMHDTPHAGAVSFGEVVYRAKLQILDQLFGCDVDRLTQALARLAVSDRHANDLPRSDLRQALLHFTALFPVYRTYTRDATVTLRDRWYVEETVRQTEARLRGHGEGEALAFLRRVLLLDPPPRHPERLADRLRFVVAWQQLSGPATAKGLEDTAFYRHTRLVSLNAVGSDAAEVDHPADVLRFHRHNRETAERWPLAMTTVSTHDTKRSADVRARINVLSELPLTWARRFRRWSAWHAHLRSAVDGGRAPNANDEMLLYQTLLGAWPLDGGGDGEGFARRIRAYMQKAVREAKRETSWLAPNAAYEEAVLRFTDGVLDRENHRFRDDFLHLESRVAFFGALNGLAQVVLQNLAPGVPDRYQGDEMWDLSLVDPDNRRPVDFRRREGALAGLRAAEAAGNLQAWLRDAMAHWRDGRLKLALTARTLALRTAEAELFAAGSYHAVPVQGDRSAHACAFARRHGNRWVVAAAPRLTTRLVRSGRFPLGPRVWQETALLLPPGAPPRWRNVLTDEVVTAEDVSDGRRLRLAHLFATLPYAALLSVE